jgi:nicotinamide-nucleotide amidase
MRAEIMSIGTEILLGDILNTNARYLARRLADLGINVYHQAVVGDNPERLKEAYETALGRADLVIATGGLGPTKDDLTKETAGDVFGKKMVLDQESLSKLKVFFDKHGRQMTENNIKQAYFPEGCTILRNDHGTAPGCIMDEGGKVLVLLPGPPKEMAPMFEDSVVPFLAKYTDGVLVSKVLRVLGLGESLMEDRVKDIMDAQTNPTIAPYAKEGESILRITARGRDEKEAEELIKPVEKEIRERLGDNVYGTDDTDIESVVAEMLLYNNLTISTAESCTGGLLSGRLINYPGVSAVFMEGAVTYSNESKIRRLGVKRETIEKFGAVSEETALEMAGGIAQSAGTDIGLSVTGIAGPGGGTDEKPVGLVYVGLYIKGKVRAKKLNLWGDRQNIRSRAVMQILDWLRRELVREGYGLK